MAEYRIDDLARAAGTTSRNVRSYQERALLPRPTKRAGRAWIYDDTHLERLKLIDALLQRGFTTAHISYFITGWESGKDLTEVLDLPHTAPPVASRDATVTLPRAAVDAFLGSDDAMVLGTLADLKLARLEGDTVVFTEPHLLEAFNHLHRGGFTLRTLVDLYGELAGRVDEIAAMMIEAGKRHLVEQHGEKWLPATKDEIARTAVMLNQLRELGVAAVNSTFAKAVDRKLKAELGEYLDSAVIRQRQREADASG